MLLYLAILAATAAGVLYVVDRSAHSALTFGAFMAAFQVAITLGLVVVGVSYGLPRASFAAGVVWSALTWSALTVWCSDDTVLRSNLRAGVLQIALGLMIGWQA